MWYFILRKQEEKPIEDLKRASVGEKDARDK